MRHFLALVRWLLGLTDTPPPLDLTYAATARCPCGAGLAYRPGDDGRSWDCSAILLGTAIPAGQPGAVEHTARKPFEFWEIKSERQPSARGATTRPED
jgi:hypothetical protein